MAERNRRIVQLHAEGLKAPAILARLGRENPAWVDYATATIRQVIHREGRANGRGRAHERAVTLG